MKKISYQTCKELAKLRGLKLVISETEFNKLINSKKSAPSKVKIKWKCDKGHQWSATYNNIKQHESGCPYCYGNLPISYQNCIDLAKRRGFEITTSEKEFISLMKYRTTVPSKLKFRWKCEKSHEWCAMYNDIQQGKGCPECTEGRYEEICRWYFEKIFKQKFNKIKLSKLIPYYNGQMHLDGFTIVRFLENQIKLAFEFNGIQHDEFPNFFHKTYQDFLEQQRYDNEKKELCEDNRINLIVFPQKIDMKMNHPAIIQGFILDEFERNTGYKLTKIRQYNHLIEWYDLKNLDNFL